MTNEKKFKQFEDIVESFCNKKRKHINRVFNETFYLTYLYDLISILEGLAYDCFDEFDETDIPDLENKLTSLYDKCVAPLYNLFSNETTRLDLNTQYETLMAIFSNTENDDVIKVLNDYNHNILQPSIAAEQNMLTVRQQTPLSQPRQSPPMPESVPEPEREREREQEPQHKPTNQTGTNTLPAKNPNLTLDFTVDDLTTLIKTIRSMHGKSPLDNSPFQELQVNLSNEAFDYHDTYISLVKEASATQDKANFFLQELRSLRRSIQAFVREYRGINTDSSCTRQDLQNTPSISLIQTPFSARKTREFTFEQCIAEHRHDHPEAYRSVLLENTVIAIMSFIATAILAIAMAYIALHAVPSLSMFYMIAITGASILGSAVTTIPLHVNRPKVEKMDILRCKFHKEGKRAIQRERAREHQSPEDGEANFLQLSPSNRHPGR